MSIDDHSIFSCLKLIFSGFFFPLLAADIMFVWRAGAIRAAAGSGTACREGILSLFAKMLT